MGVTVVPRHPSCVWLFDVCMQVVDAVHAEAYLCTALFQGPQAYPTYLIFQHSSPGLDWTGLGVLTFFGEM